MKRLLKLLMAAALLTLAACERRPLEEYDYNMTRVRIDVDWESYFSERPSGMTVMVFDQEGRRPATTVTNYVGSATVALPEGTYRLLVFNQSFDEFGSMRFGQTDRHDSLHVEANAIVTHQNTDWDQGIVYMRDPEPIGSAVDTFTITQDMLTESMTFREHPRTRSVPQLDQQEGVWVLSETVYPLTSMLYVRVHIKGMNNMRSVVGSIDGMADGCQLSSAHRTTTKGRLLLDSWNAADVQQGGSEGWITTSIPTFGLPFGKERVEDRDPADNVIRLNFTLKDGSSRQFVFNVSKAIKYREGSEHLVARASVQLDLELIIEAPLFPDIVLPDVEPGSSGGSGFDAEVDDWDDGGTIDVPF